jgi:DNA-binding CsgD family transcriptional regulator
MNRRETNQRKGEIARYLASGLNYKEICKLMGITKNLFFYYKRKVVKELVKK